MAKFFNTNIIDNVKIVPESDEEIMRKEKEQEINIRVRPPICKFWEHNYEDVCEKIGGEIINLKDEGGNAYIMDTNIKEVMDNIIKSKEEQIYLNRENRMPAFIVDSPTNSGKTYFVFEYLVETAKKRGKKLLYLANRESLKAQVKKDVIERYGTGTDIYKAIKGATTSADNITY